MQIGQPEESKAERTTPRNKSRLRAELNVNRKDTREALLWCGMELLTEHGFHAINIEDVLEKADVARGSFYHFFASKQVFLSEVVTNCAEYYRTKYERIFLNSSRSAVERIREFGSQAMLGMERFDYKRGCLVGNLGQELSALDSDMAQRLDEIMMTWENALENCLKEGVERGELDTNSNCKRLSQFFFTGWQGAVMRCKMKRSSDPIALYINTFLSSVITVGEKPFPT